MPKIALELLSRDHLARCQSIDVVDVEGSTKLVWDSKRLLPFVGADHAGIVLEHGIIQVSSLAAESLVPVYAKLTEIDLHHDKRLVR